MNDLDRIDNLIKSRSKILTNIEKKIIGQKDIVDGLLIAIFAGGHVMLTGVPGLAKTLMITTIAKTLDLDFKRIQFTPDLMPSDIIGTDILEQNISSGDKEFRFIKGPLFSNIILADEINRTPPKTQSALLQAMQEKEVSAGNITYDLDMPFFVMATRNPIEQEGTYPLPEAQLDRFLFNLIIDYPDLKNEINIVLETTSGNEVEVEKVLNRSQILEIQDLVKRIPVTENIVEFAVDIVRRTRPSQDSSPQFTKDSVSWGAGPRAGQFLVIAAKINAIFNGRKTPEKEDVIKVAKPVLRHRIIPNFRAEAEGITPDIIIDKIINSLT